MTLSPKWKEYTSIYLVESAWRLAVKKVQLKLCQNPAPQARQEETKGEGKSDRREVCVMMYNLSQMNPRGNQRVYAAKVSFTYCAFNKYHVWIMKHFSYPREHLCLAHSGSQYFDLTVSNRRKWTEVRNHSFSKGSQNLTVLFRPDTFHLMISEIEAAG